MSAVSNSRAWLFAHLTSCVVAAMQFDCFRTTGRTANTRECGPSSIWQLFVYKPERSSKISGGDDRTNLRVELVNRSAGLGGSGRECKMTKFLGPQTGPI